MTCIIGLHDGNVVHMGADDEISSEIVHTNGAKIVRFPSGLIAGFAGSRATQNVMVRPDGRLRAVTDLDIDGEVDAVFDQLQNIAHYQVKGALDGAFWASLMLAKGAAMVCVTNLGGWYRVTDEFRCIGDGSQVATGAMHVLRGSPPRERIERSIEAASKYVKGVGKMSHYESTTSAPLLSRAPQVSPDVPEAVREPAQSEQSSGERT
jgi:ATP-dependent protease HslVU (ClpYQ) peptidase subunit